MFGASVASRSYSNANGDHVEVQITGDSAMVMQFATLLNNPQIAGVMGKLIRVGSQRAIQSADGDINLVISNKFLVTVQGSGSAADKIAYAQAVDVIRLSKM
jgi:carboxylesterase type B